MNQKKLISRQRLGMPRMALLSVILAGACAQAAFADANLLEVCQAGVSLPATLTINAGYQEPLTLPVPVTRVAVGEPTIADVTLTDARSLLVLARKAGDTSLLVWTKCERNPMKIVIKVPAISSALQQLTQKQTPDMLAKLPSQVQVDIRFVELSRSRLSDLGARLLGTQRGNLFASPTGSGVSGSAGAGSLIAPTFPLDGNAFNIVWGGGSSRFLTAINLLEQTGYAYTLSQPSLVAMSGQSASFLAGGEVPIPVPQTGAGGGGITIQYKEFGVRLMLTPTIVSSDQIFLKVAPEVSDLDFANAITIQGSTVPALRIRRTDTSISLADGESFIISGLITRSTVNNADKLPGLSDIPILGAFFRSNRFQTDDRELLMIVTPRLVRPFAVDAKLPPLPGEGLRSYQPTPGQLFWRGSESPDRDPSIGFSR